MTRPCTGLGLVKVGWLEALPGKGPDKIRPEHPTIVVMDEAAFNEHGVEAYGNAVSARPKKLLALSSGGARLVFRHDGTGKGHSPAKEAGSNERLSQRKPNAQKCTKVHKLSCSGVVRCRSIRSQ